MGSRLYFTQRWLIVVLEKLYFQCENFLKSSYSICRAMSGKWDEVDPRVEWAMKIMDSEGEHFDSEVLDSVHECSGSAAFFDSWIRDPVPV